MPLFTKLELVSWALSTHAASFRKLYEFHSLSCGSPLDFLQLAPKLASSEGFRLDFSDLARTVRDRERGGLSAADMLTIVAVGIGGPGITDSEMELDEAARTVQVLLAGVGGWRDEGATPASLPPAERVSGGDDRGPANGGQVVEARPGTVLDRGAGGGDGLERVVATGGVAPEMTDALSRLELASIQLKMYLDDIDRRMGRIEPNLEELRAMLQLSAERLRREEVQIRPSASNLLPEEIAPAESPRAARVRLEDSMAAAMDRSERERGVSSGLSWDSAAQDAEAVPHGFPMASRGDGQRDVGRYSNPKKAVESQQGASNGEAAAASAIRPRTSEIKHPQVAGEPVWEDKLARTSADDSVRVDRMVDGHLPWTFEGGAGESLGGAASESPAMGPAQIAIEDLEPAIEVAAPISAAAKSVAEALPPTAAEPETPDHVADRAGTAVEGRVWPAPSGGNAPPDRAQARPPRIWVARRDPVPQSPGTAAIHAEIQAINPVLVAPAAVTSGPPETLQTVLRPVELPQTAVSGQRPELPGGGVGGKAARPGSAVGERHSYLQPGGALATSQIVGVKPSAAVALKKDLRSGPRRGVAGWAAVAAALLVTMASAMSIYRPWLQAHPWDVLGWTPNRPSDPSPAGGSGAETTSGSQAEVAATRSALPAGAPRSGGPERNAGAGGRRTEVDVRSSGMTNKVAERPVAPAVAARPAQQSWANGSGRGAPGSHESGMAAHGAAPSTTAPTGTNLPLADSAVATTTSRRDEGSASTDGIRNRVEGVRSADAPKAIRVENLHPDGAAERAPLGGGTSSPAEGAVSTSRAGGATLTPASLTAAAGGGGSASLGDVPRTAGPRIGGGEAPATLLTTGGTVLRAPVPIYPERARQMRIQGTVVIRATVDKDGRVKDMQVVDGPVVLQQSAQDAVRRRQYKPFVSGGQPIEFQTLVTLNYKLAR